MWCRKRSLQVKVPKGVREGQLIRLVRPGSRHRALTGGQPVSGGAFHARRALARRRARCVPAPAAVPLGGELGASVLVPTPTGEVEVTVPAHSLPGRKLRLKGRGIPSTPAGRPVSGLDVVQPPAHSDSAAPPTPPWAKPSRTSTTPAGTGRTPRKEPEHAPRLPPARATGRLLDEHAYTAEELAQACCRDPAWVSARLQPA